MAETKYLIVGASHAGLQALQAIRAYDADGRVVMATREAHLPYSPTILPYVVSGRARPDRVRLRDEAFFRNLDVEFLRGARLAGLDSRGKRAMFADGRSWTYEKLLLATGASPVVPPVKGLDTVAFHVLRSMDDALRLRQAIGTARTAVVLGGGLIGTHAAENLAETGVAVTLIEKRDQLLPGYFDRAAAAIIEDAFTRHGIELVFGHGVAEVEPGAVILDDGREIAFDLLLVAAGVRPDLDYLEGPHIAVGRGILVDEAMRSSAPDVWAAGDCAEARLFQAAGRGIAGILPVAVEQGRIAGMSMAGDRAAKPFPGSVPLNTYTFFGQQAISVGAGAAGPAPAGAEDVVAADSATNGYRRLILKDGRLMAAAAINVSLDPGILWQLILRGTDFTAVRDAFLADPLATGQFLMSREWR